MMLRFVPNGGRIYYTERSQPPLLSDMVCEVYSARPDAAFLARALPSLVSDGFYSILKLDCSYLSICWVIYSYIYIY